ncbi:MAG: PilZ domain-containing protein [Colwellia sp.]|nr:PilZ domain-containing protein [Colwellia sp.]
MENRRQFTRILLSTQATLEIEDQTYPVSIQDISLNGALITSASCNKSLKGKLGTLNFLLNDGKSEVAMDIAVVHEDQEEAGLQCNAIDIDSVTQLKRIIINESINLNIEQIKVE